LILSDTGLHSSGSVKKFREPEWCAEAPDHSPVRAQDRASSLRLPLRPHIWYKPLVRRHPTAGLVALAAAVAISFVQPAAGGWVGSPDDAALTGFGPVGAGTGHAVQAGEPGTPAPAARRTTAAGGPEAPDRPLRHNSGPVDPSQLSGYVWPLPRGRITQPFGPSWAGTLRVDGVPFHDGVDMATFCGDHVLAAHDGVVLAAGRRVDPWMGWVGSLAPSVERRDRHKLWYSLPIIVVVDDGNGYRSIYAHLNALNVHAGQRVRAGQFLGWEGSTGFATGCHLHYGLFSPFETRVFGLDPAVAKRTKLPAFELARIDPLLVLPPRGRSIDDPDPIPKPTTASQSAAWPTRPLSIRAPRRQL
jgi:murein DD-endopeptidase MepM/ murein hydrolase activator NlpD